MIVQRSRVLLKKHAPCDFRNYECRVTAAHLLARRHQVTVFEAGVHAGGLAQGFKDEAWNWSLEHFYHHEYTTPLTQCPGCHLPFSVRQLTVHLRSAIGVVRIRKHKWNFECFISPCVFKTDSKSNLVVHFHTNHNYNLFNEYKCIVCERRKDQSADQSTAPGTEIFMF